MSELFFDEECRNAILTELRNAPSLPADEIASNLAISRVREEVSRMVHANLIRKVANGDYALPAAPEASTDAPLKVPQAIALDGWPDAALWRQERKKLLANNPIEQELEASYQRLLWANVGVIDPERPREGRCHPDWTNEAIRKRLGIRLDS